MKRILSACLEQTQRFEDHEAFAAYCRMLDRKHIRYQVLEKTTDASSLIVHMRRAYLLYPTGEYLEEKEEEKKK
jgi:hypothetical protein